LHDEELFALFFVFFFIVIVFFLYFFVYAAWAELGVEAVVAFLFIFANIIEWSELGSVSGLLGGLDGFVCVEGLIAINEAGGNFESAEKSGSLFEIDAATNDGIVDAGNGELDGGGIFGRGKLQRSQLEVRVGAGGVSFGMVVAKLAAFQSGGLTAESVGLDVATQHEHSGRAPFLHSRGKLLIVIMLARKHMPQPVENKRG
jgi:hypothetical protein